MITRSHLEITVDLVKFGTEFGRIVVQDVDKLPLQAKDLFHFGSRAEDLALGSVQLEKDEKEEEPGALPKSTPLGGHDSERLCRNGKRDMNETWLCLSPGR